ASLAPASSALSRGSGSEEPSPVRQLSRATGAAELESSDGEHQPAADYWETLGGA
ncbi:unnamed protein product, partial [Polarella glacialis]